MAGQIRSFRQGSSLCQSHPAHPLSPLPWPHSHAYPHSRATCSRLAFASTLAICSLVLRPFSLPPWSSQMHHRQHRLMVRYLGNVWRHHDSSIQFVGDSTELHSCPRQSLRGIRHACPYQRTLHCASGTGELSICSFHSRPNTRQGIALCALVCSSLLRPDRCHGPCRGVALAH